MGIDECPHPGAAPAETKINLSISQAGPGRHKCVDCAYHAGILNQNAPSNEDVEMEECQHGNRAPRVIFTEIHESQAGEGRHKCAVCAYAAGTQITWDYLEDEIEKPEIYKEGSTKRIAVNVYERSPKARAKCIDHYGAKCAICEFDFEKEYGEVGKGVIQVHHKIPLAKVGADYVVDPISDLVPVCPNCHVIMHKRNPPYTVDDVKGFMKNN